MPAEARLDALLRSMAPKVIPGELYYITREAPLPPSLIGEHVFAAVSESEGITYLIDGDGLQKIGAPPAGRDAWTRITLSVHSDLNAVGFLAAILPSLRDAGIPVNVLSAFHHDHLLVPTGRAERALEILTALSQEA